MKRLSCNLLAAQLTAFALFLSHKSYAAPRVEVSGSEAMTEEVTAVPVAPETLEGQSFVDAVAALPNPAAPMFPQAAINTNIGGPETASAIGQIVAPVSAQASNQDSSPYKHWLDVLKKKQPAHFEREVGTMVHAMDIVPVKGGAVTEFLKLSIYPPGESDMADEVIINPETGVATFGQRWVGQKRVMFAPERKNFAQKQTDEWVTALKGNEEFDNADATPVPQQTHVNSQQIARALAIASAKQHFDGNGKADVDGAAVNSDGIPSTGFMERVLGAALTVPANKDLLNKFLKDIDLDPSQAEVSIEKIALKQKASNDTPYIWTLSAIVRQNGRPGRRLEMELSSLRVTQGAPKATRPYIYNLLVKLSPRDILFMSSPETWPIRDWSKNGLEKFWSKHKEELKKEIPGIVDGSPIDWPRGQYTLIVQTHDASAPERITKEILARYPKLAGSMKVVYFAYAH